MGESLHVDDPPYQDNCEGKTKDEDGWEIEPFRFYIFKNGWLAGIISPNGGELLLDEDDLIEAFKAELPENEEVKVK